MAAKKSTSFQILSKAIQDKKRHVKGLSIRLLSQKMGISHSYLSRALQGQKGLSKTQVDQLCKLLDVNEITRALLDKALITEASKRRGIESVDTHVGSKTSFVALEDFEEIKDREFTLYDEWYLIPIMDLTTLKHFKSDPKWIGAKLGISIDEADKALTKLLDNGYLKPKAKGLTKTDQKMRIHTVKSLAKIRSYHKHMMLKALEELETKTDDESFQKRLISGISIAVNPDNIPKARQIIQAAMHEVATVLLEGSCTELYHLNTQLIPLLKK